MTCLPVDVEVGPQLLVEGITPKRRSAHGVSLLEHPELVVRAGEDVVGSSAPGERLGDVLLAQAVQGPLSGPHRALPVLLEHVVIGQGDPALPSAWGLAYARQQPLLRVLGLGQAE